MVQEPGIQERFKKKFEERKSGVDPTRNVAPGETAQTDLPPDFVPPPLEDDERVSDPSLRELEEEFARRDATRAAKASEFQQSQTGTSFTPGSDVASGESTEQQALFGGTPLTGITEEIANILGFGQGVFGREELEPLDALTVTPAGKLAGAAGGIARIAKLTKASKALKKTLGISGAGTQALRSRLAQIFGRRLSDDEIIKASGRFTQSKEMTARIASSVGLNKPLSASKIVKTNTKTIRKTIKFLTKNIQEKSGRGLAASRAIAKALFYIIGPYGFAEWVIFEARVSANIAHTNAVKSGNVDLIAETIKLNEEVYDLPLWQDLIRFLPGGGFVPGFVSGFKALSLNRRVNDQISADEIYKIENNLTEDEVWEARKIADAEEDKAAVDHFNSEKTIQEANARELDAEADDIRNAKKEASEKRLRDDFEKRDQERLDRAFDNEIRIAEATAAFWRNERRLTEIREQEAAADRRKFNLEYQKRVQEIRTANQPSNLNFGLL